ncbi:hypothetical protein EUTSA_v10021827mg [Eutrema salsugineum]|uniref:Uncharacterized protein n=1 Tax=Eutrema salsugineum TaxID=72664 RepID=V4LEY3_EUTSA|nr:hypothetical protein EUTSA_v10021827mg [Eutrema salsugineum]
MLCQIGPLESISYLIESGADAKMEDEKGKTVLYHAVTSSHTDEATQIGIVDRLMEAGADAKLPTHAGLKVR